MANYYVENEISKYETIGDPLNDREIKLLYKAVLHGISEIYIGLNVRFSNSMTRNNQEK